ncbi:MAG: tripartite tricarboxylate transporter substrate binding protein [Alphaproteobacteria bacterium]|nr:tripartite tricarboxylate transporter substrate binding protein [Alphaproteobacteria bacterium]
MKLRTQIIALAAAMTTCAGLPAHGAAAAGYPERTITWLHGFGAGGNADVISRLLAGAMSESMGQSIVVEAHPGAGGNIAAERAAKAKPDGYTLILLPSGHAVSAGLYKHLPFDPLNDFTWISESTSFTFIISVRADSPFKTLNDVIAAAKANPGKMSFSSVGIGSTQQLCGELFKSMAGIDMVHVPYKGGTAPLTDLLGGHIDVMVDTNTVTTPQIKGGKIRGLGESADQPWPGLAGIPPIAETLPGYNVLGWTGVAGPKGLPKEIVDKLNAEVHKALASPTVKERMEEMGNLPTASTPDQMKQVVARDIGTFKKVIEQANIPLQD